MANPQQQWIDLFNDPDPGKMVQLGQQFKAFVRYIFERAGYRVEPDHNDGADFVLFDGNKTEAIVTASAGANRIGKASVFSLKGAPAPRGSLRFYIALNDFMPEVYEEALPQMKDMRLIDGVKLIRYISYIRGTRHPKARSTPISPAAMFDNEPEKRQTTRTKVITLANNKGGVCKTTSAYAIALILATELQKRVLLVDLDDQANLTQAAFGQVQRVEGNISDYFVGVSSLPQLIVSTRFPNLWAIPSHPNLRLTLSNTVDWLETEQHFIDDIHHPSLAVPKTGEDFDWIIIDTPPSLALYTRAALLASHYVLAPFTSSILDQEGLKNLIETLEEIRCITNAAAQTKVLGCFLTRWKTTSATREDAQLLKGIVEGSNVPLFKNEIGEDTTNTRKLLLTESPKNIPKIHGFLDQYRKLVKEIRDYVSDN